MKRKSILTLALALICVVGLLTFDAQARGTAELRAMVGQKLLDAIPLGEPLPDLDLYDDRGNIVRLGNVDQGKYRVLILGCLT